jgi:hypothetical protein
MSKPFCRPNLCTRGSRDGLLRLTIVCNEAIAASVGDSFNEDDAMDHDLMSVYDHERNLIVMRMTTMSMSTTTQ